MFGVPTETKNYGNLKMKWFSDPEFFGVLVQSKTFFNTLVEPVAVVLLGVLAIYFVLKSYVFRTKGERLFSSKSLVDDQSGAASAVDFVMVIPFFMFIMCLFVQMAMIVNASLIVHYSAFSAARSARVHFCDRSVAEYPRGYYLGCDRNRAQREAEKAAKFVLIAASPVDSSVSSSGSPPQDILNWLSQQYLERSSPLVTQARFAFDARNVDVVVRPAQSDNPLIRLQHEFERVPPTFNLNELADEKLRNNWPVTVSVRYSKHLGVPIVGPFLSDERRGNEHFKTIEAKITLL